MQSIKQLKEAELNLKILKQDRPEAEIERERQEGEWERTIGEWERTKGQFDKDEIKNSNTIEFSPYLKVKRFLEESYPEYATSLLDSITDGQYESKRWMSQILKPERFGSKDPFKIEIIGAWFGWPLIEMLEDTIVHIEQIDLYDPDEVCQEVVRKYKYHFEPSYNINQFGDYFERNE